ncbi:MAG: four helix bundle protein [Gemmatimonadetes bacterium]|nr:four helix bundle protein [Gemmatimonadota bacterium]
MNSYRSLRAWQHAHAAAVLAHRAADASNHPGARSLFEQLKRAAFSVEANIVEGYALHTLPLRRQHYWRAFGSAAEAECAARLAEELGYLDGAVVAELERPLGDVMRTLRGLLDAHPPAWRRRPSS